MRIAYMEKIDPARNQMRFYSINLAPTLFGDWAMVREWGRIGQAGRVLETWFPGKALAEQAGRVLAGKKQRRGYRVTSESVRNQ